MMQTTRRRIGHPAWLGLVLVVGLPALAEAQLFPNRTVTRQRQDCASEPPFYSTVRHNYFGYYPTCWNRFPAGWGCPCPNPELPNRSAEFARQKRDDLPTTPPDAGLDPEMIGDEPADPAAGRPSDDPGIPALPDPRARAPFNRETAPPDTAPPASSRPGGSATRPTSPPLPTTNPTSVAPTTTALLEMPRIVPPPAVAPIVPTGMDSGLPALSPDAVLTSIQPSSRPDLGPLPAPAPPNASTPIVTGLGTVDPTLLAGSSATPAQAPQRKGLLGGLFNSAKRKR